jgi:hypothetical protein
MWRVQHLELRPTAFDFQSSGQGLHHGQSLHADGTMIVNDISLADLAASRCQVTICDDCGTIGCQSGNWIVMRRVGRALAWIPDFDRMSTDELERTLAAPPLYVQTRGAPLFLDPVLSQLHRVAPGISVDSLPPMTHSEAVRLLQWEAPGEVLGRFPDTPVLRREVVLAAHPVDADAGCEALNAFLTRKESEVVGLAPAGAAAVTFYLDLPGTPEWQPLAQEPSGRLIFNLAAEAG